MPFNSNSYYRNKEKRAARLYLTEAREWKQRLVAGTLDFPLKPEWAKERIASRVKLARLHWRSYLGYLRNDHCAADLRRFKRGDITYTDFMSKWGPKGALP